MASDYTPEGGLVEIELVSHLTFRAEFEPENDAAVQKLAEDFAEPFGEILKTRTNATTIRYVEVMGGRGNSGEILIAFKCFYFTASALLTGKQLFDFLPNLPAGWANAEWRRQLGNHIADAESKVSIRGNSALPTSVVPSPASPKAWRSRENWTAFAVAAILGAAFGVFSWFMAVDASKPQSAGPQVYCYPPNR